ncbi:uncharacterized protein LOC127149747 [Cucumis melo]|uniref:Uncharacterized protein LOC127149747 n=1 Tax=Cucumis melo TaxID=3656 RepID=A0ABM3KUV3_CUCME|nr:uncharacterized protein LOC127149747 [Cucumis melo]
MCLLESSTPGICEELESIGFAKWSRAYSPRKRYNVMTTNISESLNSAMLKAMELPICSMLDILRMMLQRWFFEQRNEVDYQVIDFTKTIENEDEDRIGCTALKMEMMLVDEDEDRLGCAALKIKMKIVSDVPY